MGKDTYVRALKELREELEVVGRIAVTAAIKDGALTGPFESSLRTTFQRAHAASVALSEAVEAWLLATPEADRGAVVAQFDKDLVSMIQTRLTPTLLKTAARSRRRDER